MLEELLLLSDSKSLSISEVSVFLEVLLVEAVLLEELEVFAVSESGVCAVGLVLEHPVHNNSIANRKMDFL